MHGMHTQILCDQRRIGWGRIRPFASSAIDAFQKTERILDKDMDAEHYGQILGRYGDSLVRNLHGHHTWEDRQLFPELASADPRFETGLDLLEQDHEVLDETLDRFTRASNRYLNCLLYTSPSPRDLSTSRMPSSA